MTTGLEWKSRIAEHRSYKTLHFSKDNTELDEYYDHLKMTPSRYGGVSEVLPKHNY